MHAPSTYRSTCNTTNSKYAAPSTEFCSWNLKLDGEAYHGSHRESSVAPLQWPLQQRQPSPSTASTTTAAAARVTSRQVYPGSEQHGDALPLTSWEATAVRVYRGVCRYRRSTSNTSATSDPRRSVRRGGAGGQECRKETANAPIIPSSLLPMLISAFPSSFAPLQQQFTTHPCDAVLQPRNGLSQPLLLEYFLRVGYPLQLTSSEATSVARTTNSHASDAYTALLLRAADLAVGWFTGVTENAERERPKDNPPTSSQRLRTFELALLPDVMQQMVAAHRMSPRTAATWLLRVYVELMNTLSTREVEANCRCDAEAGRTSLSTDCLERIHQCAEAMRDAVYQLQGNVLPVVWLDDRLPGADVHRCIENDVDEEHGGVDEKAVEEPPKHSMEAAMHKDEWRFFYLLFLQQATSLLFRGCLAETAGALEERGSCSSGGNFTLLANADALMPPVPTSAVVLEGLMRCVFLTRAHFEFFAPIRQYHRTDVSGHGTFYKLTCEDGLRPPWPQLTSEKRVLHVMEKQWVAFTCFAVRRLTDLGYNYYRYVPLLDFVLALR